MDLKNTVQTIADFIPQYCRRNKVILQDKTRKTERKKVNVHYWRKNKRGGQKAMEFPQSYICHRQPKVI
jgi:hypothetical protein